MPLDVHMALILAILNDRDAGTEIADALGANNDVATADSLGAAINTLQTNHVDLIICDLGLVDTNGRFNNAFEFLEWLKKDAHWSEIPFLCFTIKTMLNTSFADGVRTAAKALGATNYCALEQLTDGSLSREVKRILDVRDENSFAA